MNLAESEYFLSKFSILDIFFQFSILNLCFIFQFFIQNIFAENLSFRTFLLVYAILGLVRFFFTVFDEKYLSFSQLSFSSERSSLSTIRIEIRCWFFLL